MKNFAIATALALSAALSSTPAVSAESYVIDTQNAHASVNFSAPHLGFSYIVGRFNAFEGEFTFDERDPKKSSVTVSVDTTSVDTNLAARDNHLRSGDFLAAEEFPVATFTSTGVKVTGKNTAVITGDLTVRGVTKSIDIEAEHVGGGADPWGNERQGFKGSAKLVLADFGIQGDFGQLEVNLDLHLEGVKK